MYKHEINSKRGKKQALYSASTPTYTTTGPTEQLFLDFLGDCEQRKWEMDKNYDAYVWRANLSIYQATGLVMGGGVSHFNGCHYTYFDTSMSIQKDYEEIRNVQR